MIARDEALRSWIYVAADDEGGCRQAFESGVDAVILDLEDLVPAANKSRARRQAIATIDGRAGHPWPRTFVRVNHSSAGVLEDDLPVAVRAGVTGIRYPKAEAPDDIRRLDAAIARLEHARGLAPGSVRIVANIESALGVLAARDVLRASDRILHLGFGEADFSRDIGARVGPAKDETFVARSLLVLASRAAGRRPPCDGAHLDRSDDTGLRTSTERGRDLGFFGRTAVHVDQVATINAVYTPDAAAIRRAEAVIAAQAEAEAAGVGSAWLDDGTFVDIAVERGARDVVELAASLRARRAHGAQA
jgi:citrate lyase subunit beta/citryl-CoA lyase